MPRHVGFIKLSVQPWSQLEIVFELGSGYLTARGTDGTWLGSWSTRKIQADLEPWGRIKLTIGSEDFGFQTDDPNGFVWDLETERLFVREMNLVERVLHAARTRGFRVTMERGLPKISMSGHTSQAIGMSFGEVGFLAGDAVISSESADLTDDRLLQKRLMTAQDDVIDALHLGTRCWFGFHFKQGNNGTGPNYFSAADGLGRAAQSLVGISDDLAGIDFDSSRWGEAVATYRSAVAGWGTALSTMAGGMGLREQRIDSELELLAEATTRARTGVYQLGKGDLSVTVMEPLAFLSNVKPPPKTARVIVERAKQPWRDAFIAAGQPLREGGIHARSTN